MTDATQAPRHTTRVRVCYGDTDQMGVVYYANYLRWFEAARSDWLRARGLPYSAIEAQGALFPVSEAHVVYRQPARYEDEVAVACWPSQVRAASLRFEYEVRRGDVLLADGYTAHACVDRNGRPRRFPAGVRERLLGSDPTATPPGR